MSVLRRAGPVVLGAAGGVGVGGVAEAWRGAGLGDAGRVGGGVRLGLRACRLAAEEAAQGGAGDPAEGALGTASVEGGDLELRRGERRGAAVAGAARGDRTDRGEGADADLEGVGQAHAGGEVLA